MDPDIIASAKNIILKKNKEDNTLTMEKVLEVIGKDFTGGEKTNLEERIGVLEEKLDLILSKLT